MNKFYTDQTREGWLKYRKKVEQLIGREFVGRIDWPELCRVQTAFEHGVTPSDYVAKAPFTQVQLTAHHQAMLDMLEGENGWGWLNDDAAPQGEAR